MMMTGVVLVCPLALLRQMCHFVVLRLSTGTASSNVSLCSVKTLHWHCFVKCVTL
jgi:hypothetical protein